MFLSSLLIFSVAVTLRTRVPTLMSVQLQLHCCQVYLMEYLLDEAMLSLLSADPPALWIRQTACLIPGASVLVSCFGNCSVVWYWKSGSYFFLYVYYFWIRFLYICTWGISLDSCLLSDTFVMIITLKTLHVYKMNIKISSELWNGVLCCQQHTTRCVCVWVPTYLCNSFSKCSSFSSADFCRSAVPHALGFCSYVGFFFHENKDQPFMVLNSMHVHDLKALPTNK